MNKKGRPKKEGLDKVVKVTVNDAVAEMLDSTAQETGKSKSDLLRELIPIVSSKDYEGLIPYTSMEILQNYSERCWDTLNKPNCIFEVNNLSCIMPAFIITEGSPVLYVKYPTFRIQIINAQNPSRGTSQSFIKQLLKDVNYHFNISGTKAECFITNGNLMPLEFPYINEILCLEITLEGNANCKNQIVEILNKNNYITSVYHSYCIRGMSVELLEEKKYFKVIHHE